MFFLTQWCPFILTNAHRIQNYAISNNREWENTCNSRYTFGVLGNSAAQVQSAGTAIVALLLLFGLFVFSKFVRRYRAKKAEGRLRLPGQEVSDKSLPDYGAILRPQDRGCALGPNGEYASVEDMFAAATHRSHSTPPHFTYF